MSAHLKTLTALTAVAVVCAGCATLPSNTSPQALRTFEQETEVVGEEGPTPDKEPDLLLRDFYAASARPTSQFATARAFLTESAATQWNPDQSLQIVDRLAITAASSSNQNERIFNISGRLVGSLVDSGTYTPENVEYKATITMRQENGQWRISDLPRQVVIERNELLNHYTPHELYFFDKAGLRLVPDRRWVYSREKSLDAVLITMLIEGPSNRISPAVTFPADANAEYVGRTDGVYEFSGFQNFDEQARLRFAGQLTWMLADAGVPQPYSITLDGAPVAEGYEQLTPEDFASLNPNPGTSAVSTLYAISEGKLLTVSSSEATNVPGSFGELDNIASADITADKAVAVVRRVDNSAVLTVGDLDGTMLDILKADTITRPSFSSTGNSVMAVRDGDKVVRVVRSSATGEFVESEVDTTGLEHIDGDISELQLSPSAARVAFIADGRVYVAIVTQPEAGTRAIVSPQEVALAVSGSALSVDWHPSGSLIVGTAIPEAPVWRVEYDGSVESTIASGNLVAPVVAVAAGSTTLYATDELAIRQLPVTGAESGGAWRDVPGLRGVRSAPILAH